MPLVLPWGQEWVRGELQIEDRSRRSAGERENSGRLRMRLDMPRLGSVDVRVRWVKGAMAVRLSLEERFLEAARLRLVELSEGLSRAGFQRAALRVEPLPPRTQRAAPGLVEIVA
jgi:hypothetical protein